MGNSKIKHLVLDVLKPHTPPLPEFASYLGELEEVTKVDVSLVEMDERTESLRVVFHGNGIDFDKLREHVSRYGAVIHSVDQVVVEKTEN
ncbi:hypothetical protein AC482_04945 [miscellaneous Crenarchaeota group-15 archaeon DG-45]|uniref:DUF211 domain-containing protein n=1 Tax=miscellaneous Crenarchaeota group-15 archaeon DG-45 TaxID=1685127 RepID=A0A0M0BN83_9ARCH|nr:MAG: hypothetical protein AC482_04945 [miscellaneous Crenarchaeota group-15 archaeon DG-45]